MMFSMWLTEDVVAKRADHLTDAERTVVAKCALCGEEAKGRRNQDNLRPSQNSQTNTSY